MFDKLSISKSEFDALPRYDLSLPTGVVAGKRWKYFNSLRLPGDQWLVGEYRETAEGAAIYTKWYRPFIRVPARRNLELRVGGTFIRMPELQNLAALRGKKWVFFYSQGWRASCPASCVWTDEIREACEGLIALLGKSWDKNFDQHVELLQS